MSSERAVRGAGAIWLTGLALTGSCASPSQPSWTYVAAPVDDPLHNGVFVDADYGWILSYGTGLVLHTQNGGDAWHVQAQLAPLYYEDIEFRDREEGWICGERGQLLHTEDGGQTWRSRELAPASVAFYGIHVPARGTGILVGVDAGGTAVLFESTDGGATWQPHHDSTPALALEPIQFVDERRGFVGGRGAILRTEDGGERWSGTDVGRESVVRGLYFLDPLHGWAVGRRGLALSTRDGGLTWQPLDRFTGNRLRSVYFVDRRRGFIVGDQDQESGSLWYTTDGGGSWAKWSDEVSDLHRLFRSPTALWAVGKAGTILRLDF